MPDFSNDVRLPLQNGLSICVQSAKDNPGGTEYVRIENEVGDELHYWDCAEWGEDPQGVMGAIFGAACGG